MKVTSFTGGAFQENGYVATCEATGASVIVDPGACAAAMIRHLGEVGGPIEAVLLTLPGVVEAAVVGVASEAWGETPVAFVVAPGGDAESLRAAANAKVGKTQRLAALVLVDELPRSHIGKVLKRELRDSFSGKIA